MCHKSMVCHPPNWSYWTRSKILLSATESRAQPMSRGRHLGMYEFLKGNSMKLIATHSSTFIRVSTNLWYAILPTEVTEHDPKFCYPRPNPGLSLCPEAGISPLNFRQLTLTAKFLTTTLQFSEIRVHDRIFHSPLIKPPKTACAST